MIKLTHNLDTRDMKLIHEMQRDASQTSEELAGRLGMSPSGVRRRVRNLKDCGLIKIVAVPNIKVLGNKVWIFIGINVTTGKAPHVARGLSKFEFLYTVALSFGRYDVIVLGTFNSTKEATDFVSLVMPKIRGIYRSEMLILTEPIKYHGLVWGDSSVKIES